MIRVVWLEHRRLCWDQHLVDEYLSGEEFVHSENDPESVEDGCILIVPARYTDPETIQAIIEPMNWVVLVLTSDEETTFDANALEHPAMRIWATTPHPSHHAPGLRNLTEGRAMGTNEVLAEFRDEAATRPLDVLFVGQTTHLRREEAVEAMHKLPPRLRVGVLPTDGFTKGIARTEYLKLLASAKIAPCPAGPATPSSFRVAEALEAGALPIADDVPLLEDYPLGYWDFVCDGEAPFPVVTDWSELGSVVEACLEDWPMNAVRAQAWWVRHKKRQADQMRTDALELSGGDAPVSSPTRIQITSDNIDSMCETIAAYDSMGDEMIIEISTECPLLELEEDEDPPSVHPYLLQVQRVVWACTNVWHHAVPILDE